MIFYYPFETQQQCTEQVGKVVRRKETGCIYVILGLSADLTFLGLGFHLNPEEMFQVFENLDGTPFGISSLDELPKDY